MGFCKDFNERTLMFKPDTPMRVMLRAFVDRSYTFVVKPPPTMWFLLKAAGRKEGAVYPGISPGGLVTAKQIYEIAKIKKEYDPDLKLKSLWAICMMIQGTAKSMGMMIADDIKYHPKMVEVKYIKDK